MRRALFTLLALTLSLPALAGVELGLGGAGGVSFWQPEVPIDGRSGKAMSPAGSPLLSVQLDPWKGPVRPVFGLSSAPTFTYSMGYDAYSMPLIVADAGLQFGGETTHGAVTGHAGLFSFGASARFSHLPVALGDKAHTGIELRATWLARWSGFAGALWTTRFH